MKSKLVSSLGESVHIYVSGGVQDHQPSFRPRLWQTSAWSRRWMPLWLTMNRFIQPLAFLLLGGGTRRPSGVAPQLLVPLMRPTLVLFINLCSNANEKEVHFLLWKNILKGIVHPKNENLLQMFSPSGHSKCKWVCFSSSDLGKCSLTSLAHQWILCSEWVPSEWESK